MNRKLAVERIQPLCCRTTKLGTGGTIAPHCIMQLLRGERISRKYISNESRSDACDLSCSVHHCVTYSWISVSYGYEECTLLSTIDQCVMNFYRRSLRHVGGQSSALFSVVSYNFVISLDGRLLFYYVMKVHVWISSNAVL